MSLGFTDSLVNWAVSAFSFWNYALHGVLFEEGESVTEQERKRECVRMRVEQRRGVVTEINKIIFPFLVNF